MTEFTLMRALRAALERRLPEMPLATPARGGRPEALRAARVWLGDLPPKADGPDQEFPFVLLQPRWGYEDAGSPDYRVEVLLRCGIYLREEGDHGEALENDLSNLVSLVRRTVRPFRLDPLDSKYVLEPDDRGRLLFWERPEKQPHPYAEAWIVSVWRMAGG